jgi:hypothetical protein
MIHSGKYETDQSHQDVAMLADILKDLVRETNGFMTEVGYLPPPPGPNPCESSPLLKILNENVFCKIDRLNIEVIIDKLEALWENSTDLEKRNADEALQFISQLDKQFDPARMKPMNYLSFRHDTVVTSLIQLKNGDVISNGGP